MSEHAGSGAPMQPQRVLVLSASVGTGHTSAAAALEEAFHAVPGVEVTTQDVLALTNDAYAKLYSDMYQMAAKRTPWLLGWVYDLNDAPFTNEQPLRKLWDMLNAQPVVRFLQAYQPDLCICTHFTPAGIVSQLMATDQLDTSLSIVTTDYDFQGMWLSQTFNRYFVARDESKARLHDLGVSAERITVSGIPVRPIFGEPVDHAAVLATYELDPALPLVVVSAGAVGGGPAVEIVHELMKLRHAIQCIVVCGTNERLRHDVEAATIERAAMFRVFGYTHAMPDFVRAATLFVGKPGGLTSSECMAAGTPMVIVTPVPGQEERNSDYLLEVGAAVRCNDLETIDYKIDQLLDDPGRLTRMRACARAVGKPDAAMVIALTALNDRYQPVQYDWRAQRDTSRTASLSGPLQRARTELTGTVALYDDERGVYLGGISDAAFRNLRRSFNDFDKQTGTATIGLPHVARLRQLGVDERICTAIERRVERYGAVRLRRSKVPRIWAAEGT